MGQVRAVEGSAMALPRRPRPSQGLVMARSSRPRPSQGLASASAWSNRAWKPDGRVETSASSPRRRYGEEEVREQLMGVNWNHIPGPSERKIERKGIFLQLDPVEFQEIVLKREYRSRNGRVNEANKQLVALYNKIQDQRFRSFWCIKKTGATDDLISELKKDYNLQLEKAKNLRQHIREMNGVPVPSPAHFADREKIFG